MHLGQNKMQGQRPSLREPACVPLEGAGLLLSSGAPDAEGRRSASPGVSPCAGDACRPGHADSSHAHAGTADAGGGSEAQQTATTKVPQKVSSQQMLWGLLLCSCLPALMLMSGSQSPLVAVQWSLPRRVMHQLLSK